MRFDAAGFLVEQGADPQTAADYLTLRKAKKAAPTSTALKAIVAEARKAGWPLQTALEMDRFFGAKGTNTVSLTLPYTMRVAWNMEKSVTRFDCNRKVKESLERILIRALDHYGIDVIRQMRLDRYGGCLNVRKMRGGSAWSIHSWGCAVDIDPDHNQLKFHRAQATLDNPEYDAWWRFVYDEGAISLGRERDYDWMHLQFARLK